jgi:hypothetical protein
MGRIEKLKRQLINEANIRILLGEQGRDKSTESDDNILGNYSTTTLDQCAYYAIEKFEEHYGNPNGESMGDNYFEGNYEKFDKIINSRVSKLTPNVWGSLSNKDKMQLWSFMYNSDSDTNDKYRWLAVLDLTANSNMSEFDEGYTMNIIGNFESTEWNDAVTRVNDNSNWDSSKLRKMIDGQYKTYDPTKYTNTWSYRPDTLDEMYDECTGTTNNSESEETPSIYDDGDIEDFDIDIVDKPTTITFNDVADARLSLSGLSKDTYGSATINGNTITITKDGDTTTKVSGVWDNISEDNLKNRLSKMEEIYGYESISDIIKIKGFWFVVLKTE